MSWPAGAGECTLAGGITTDRTALTALFASVPSNPASVSAACNRSSSGHQYASQRGQRASRVGSPSVRIGPRHAPHQ